MNANNLLMSNIQDHIMANTWRLIFERRQRRQATTISHPIPTPDFSRLEKILPEYRLIGLEIAARHPRRPQ